MYLYRNIKKILSLKSENGRQVNINFPVASGDLVLIEAYGVTSTETQITPSQSLDSNIITLMTDLNKSETTHAK